MKIEDMTNEQIFVAKRTCDRFNQAFNPEEWQIVLGCEGAITRLFLTAGSDMVRTGIIIEKDGSVRASAPEPSSSSFASLLRWSKAHFRRKPKKIT